MWTVIGQFAALFAIRGRLKIKVKFGQLFCEYCYSQFICTINSFMWTFIHCSQKFINTMLSISVMEGIVFVYIFKAISFAGHLNEYSPFVCLQQLIRCFLFANVNESLGCYSTKKCLKYVVTNVKQCQYSYLYFQSFKQIGSMEHK